MARQQDSDRERELCLFVFVHVRKTSVGMFILKTTVCTSVYLPYAYY